MCEKYSTVVSLPEIFKGPSHLHLAIWSRVDHSIHSKSLDFLKSIARADYCDLVLPMLRPLGRGPGGYEEFKKAFTEFSPCENSSADFSDVPFLDVNAGTRSAHCELWIQVADKVNEMVRQELRNHFSCIQTAFLFFDRNNPLWEPLGANMKSCQYAGARNGRGTQILCEIGEERTPWLLKLIWYKAAKEISEWLNSSPFQPIDPQKQPDLLCDMMSGTFADIDLLQFGMSDSSIIVDPTVYRASHLAAFSFNSILKVETLYIHQIDQYLNNVMATHPYMFPNRDAFLSLFCR